MSLVTLLVPIIAFLQPAVQAESPQLEARLYAARETVQPGGETELAIALKLTEDWYLYHPITLGTGLPTTVEFELPPGVTAEAPRFPTPSLHRAETEGLKQEYLSLGEDAVILAKLHVAADVPTEPIEIRATVRGLACKKLCVPVEAKASLTLNVASEPPAAANVELFEEARDELPQPFAKAEYIEDSRLVVSHTQVPIGGTASVAAVVRVRAGHHVQDRDPGAEALIASRLFIETRDGIKFDADAQIWPKAHVRDMEFFGKVREQSGEFVIQAPFEINDEKFKPGPVRLAVLFQYQSCSDAGQCFFPMMAEGFVEFEVVAAGSPAVASDDPIVAKLATVAAASADTPTEAAVADGQGRPDLWLVFLGAFLGGAILNIMPCVLPVISLKIFGFVQQSQDDRGRIFRMGLMYAAGIMASFAVLAIAMFWAKIAWGGLMQQPAFLIGLSAVVFAFALSLLGVFELQLPGAAVSAAGEAAAKEGYGGAFLNGILATLLATPCVGPFLGSAVGVLAQLPASIGAAGIMVVGLGLAAPYVLLTAFPGWLRFLPKPGPWMVAFKQIVGFILIIVVVWLLSILIKMVGDGEILATLGLLCAVGIGCWLLGKISLTADRGRAVTIWIAALALTFGGGWTSFRVFGEHEAKIPWQKWEPGLAGRLAEEGYAVYVDYTANWCLTCQWNKATVLETNRIAAEFERLGVYPIKGDFTNYNKQMQSELQQHGRNGVPLNIVIPAGNPTGAIVLPEVLTKRIVLDALEQAGQSEQIPDFWNAGP